MVNQKVREFEEFISKKSVITYLDKIRSRLIDTDEPREQTSSFIEGIIESLSETT